VRPAALKTGVEVGVVELTLEGPVEAAAAPAGAVGVTRRMEEVLAPQDIGQTVVVTVTVAVTTGLDPEADLLAETSGTLEWPDLLGAEEETTGTEVAVTAGVLAGVVEPAITVEDTVAEVSVSQGVVVASAGVEEEMTVEETMPEVKVSQGVVEATEEELDPPFWQSASPKTARHRLTGMLMRPPEEEELCLQWTSPRTARQTLIGTLIRESLLLLEEAWSHLALPRAATQLSTGTLIKPLVAVCCLHSVSPRIAAQRPTGALIKLSLA